MPYEEKEQVKRLGARWNPDLKKWFLPDGVEVKKFAQWLPPTPHIKLLAPVFLVKAMHPNPCYKCGAYNDIYALAASGLVNLEYRDLPKKVEQFALALNVRIIPEPLVDFLKKYCPDYYMAEHDGTKAYFNHCRVCQTIIGSGSRLFSPHAAFLPKSNAEAENMTLYEISDSTPIDVNCTWWARPETRLVGECSPRQPLEALIQPI